MTASKFASEHHSNGQSAQSWNVASWHECQCPQSGGTKDRILLKGGIVMSMDPTVGDFWKADVLIEGKKILAVEADIDVQDAQVIECGGLVIMPGFVNTHHHQYYAAQRAILSDGVLFGPWPQESYFSLHEITTTGRMMNANYEVIWDLGRSPYDPEDCYIAELIASVNQIDQGVTTGIDTSQSCHTPEHTNALIEGIMASGRRTLYAYSYGRSDQPGYEFPGKIGDSSKGLGRLKASYFSSDDQLVTLGLNPDHFMFTGFVVEDFAYARSLGVPLVQHGGPLPGALAAGLMGPDCVYIHATNPDPTNPALPRDTWQAIVDHGCHVSIAPIIEMQMGIGHGIPPLQDALDNGILPSLSSDVETNMTADMFTIMRSAFSVQRMLISTRQGQGEQNLPPLLTCNQVLQMATVAGAAAAQVGHKVGSLTPGKEADIIMLDARAPNTAGFNNVPGAVVTLMDASNVVNVMIAGAVKKWNGKLVDVDMRSLAHQIEQSQERILARVRSKPLPVDGLHSAPGFTPPRFGSCCISHAYRVR
jgi:5-methylthioadenosine/S-adenosylhomocysteine deaminase